MKRDAIKRWGGRLIRALVGLACGLTLVEVALWTYPLDWRFLRGGMPRMEKELQVHTAVQDPRFLVRLKPGSRGAFTHAYGPFSVTVNALGFRGPQRSRKKGRGVFRIICVGGSNVYGAGLDDHQTWPAQLQRRLDASAPGRYEVWNLGVSGYNNLQLSAMAAEALERYEPDLLILAMSNWGPRHFLAGTPDLASYYRADPTLWLEMFPASYLGTPSWIPRPTKLMLLSRLGLYRLALAARLASRPDDRLSIPGSLREPYARITRATLTRAARQTRVAVFICPAVQPSTLFADTYRGLDIPVMILDAGGRPPEYRMFHPPARVMTWYAERLAAWLQARALLASDPGSGS